jgi:hypothetical protein
VKNFGRIYHFGSWRISDHQGICYQAYDSRRLPTNGGAIGWRPCVCV